eukprot:1081229-Amphidinium_carterae.1
MAVKRTSSLTSSREPRPVGGTDRVLRTLAWETGITCTVPARVTGGNLARLARLLYRLRLLAPTRGYGPNLPFRKLCRDFELLHLHTKVLPGLSLPLQVQPALALPLLRLPTKADTRHDLLLALGKASLPQT